MRVEEIHLLVADVVLPPPDITVSQWDDENRRLSSESAAQRGEWRTDRAPYQRAIRDALSPNHRCEQVGPMSGAQLGRTSILEHPDMPARRAWRSTNTSGWAAWRRTNRRL